MMTYYVRNSSARTERGNYAVELPGALLIIFFVFVFPLINLGTMGLRYGILLAAARDGAHAASKCYTFQVGSAGKPAAVQAAPDAVSRLVGQFSGVTVESVDVDILVTSLSTNSVTRFESRLPGPADPSSNVYGIEAEVVGVLEPLLPYAGPLFGNIPGLTSPVTARVVSTEFAEAPHGLNQ